MLFRSRSPPEIQRDIATHRQPAYDDAIDPERVEAARRKTRATIDYSVDLELDLSTVVPGVAGPKRPQDHINLPDLKKTFTGLFTKALPDSTPELPTTVPSASASASGRPMASPTMVSVMQRSRSTMSQISWGSSPRWV